MLVIYCQDTWYLVFLTVSCWLVFTTAFGSPRSESNAILGDQIYGLFYGYYACVI
jgi:hypothetical protein